MLPNDPCLFGRQVFIHIFPETSVGQATFFVPIALGYAPEKEL